MTFRFQNLGPVRDGRLALGDLTLIVGKNNTGKTYVAYAMYGMLRALHGFVPNFLDVLPLPTRDGPIRLSESAFNQKRDGVAFMLSELFSRVLPQFFSASSSDLRHPSATISVEPVSLSSLPASHSIDGAVFFERDDAALTITAPELSDAAVRRHPSLVAKYISFLFPDLPDPFILTSERFGISLFYKELDFARSEMVDRLHNLSIGSAQVREPRTALLSRMSRYARPIKDNIDYTRFIPDRTKVPADLHDAKLFRGLEEMMAGYYVASSNNVRFRSVADESDDRHFDIPIHTASSSARGLSDLYFFFKHEAAPGQLLIIDEPESHLDTHNQIALARLIARAVNAGMKVLVTTHSDYLVKEFNNLIMLGRDVAGHRDFMEANGYRHDEYVSRSSVKAYTAERNTLNECEIDDLGFLMPVFDETIDDINRIAFELLTRAEDSDE